MKVYEHIQKFKIKYCDVDFKDELKISTALALMEEVACDSADELGFGYSFVKPRGYAFMVTNVYMEFVKPIGLGHSVFVKTWPTVPSRVIFGREYQFEDEDGALLLNATSRWCLIDMNSGKLLPSKAIDNQNYATYNTRKLFEDVAWKIPAFPLVAEEPRFSMTVANSEYDHNMHVNNTRYAEYCVNCFTVSELSKMRLRRFSISYVRQCREGDELRFFRKSIGGGVYAIQGINQSGEIVVQARLEVEE